MLHFDSEGFKDCHYLLLLFVKLFLLILHDPQQCRFISFFIRLRFKSSSLLHNHYSIFILSGKAVGFSSFGRSCKKIWRAGRFGRITTKICCPHIPFQIEPEPEPEGVLVGQGQVRQSPARVSFLENSQSRTISTSLSLLEKKVKGLIFHFSLLEKGESFVFFTPISQEKRVKTSSVCHSTSAISSCIFEEKNVKAKSFHFAFLEKE